PDDRRPFPGCAPRPRQASSGDARARRRRRGPAALEPLVPPGGCPSFQGHGGAARPGQKATVQRQTMSATVGEVTLTTPSGKTRSVTLSQAEPGVWRSTVEANELGLWRATDGTL